MKPYLVDVPVKINIWIRPECQKKQFEVIKKARPSILFIQSDGGRSEEEWEKIHANRAYVESQIDWDCTVYKIYEDHNNGIYSMSKKTGDLIWSKVDRCIFMEDDQVPAVSYFKFCAELLEKYKDDERIGCICGFNNLGVWEKASADYFFSRRGSIWGYATWKRVIDKRNDFSYCEDPYVMGLLKERTKKDKRTWEKIVGYAKDRNFEGHMAAGEFYFDFFVYAHQQLQIVPKRNLISNIGATNDSAHADEVRNLPKAIRTQFNSKTYEIQFPIKHPKYVIPDEEFAGKRDSLLAMNHPLINKKRKIERAAALFLHGNYKTLFNKIRKQVNRNLRAED